MNSAERHEQYNEEDRKRRAEAEARHKKMLENNLLSATRAYEENALLAARTAWQAAPFELDKFLREVERVNAFSNARLLATLGALKHGNAQEVDLFVEILRLAAEEPIDLAAMRRAIEQAHALSAQRS